MQPASEEIALRPLVGDFEEIALPAGPGAGQPFVAASSSGGVLVSWLEPADGGGHALKFARVDGATPPEARLIARRDDFFVNFADFPSIVDSGGVLFAHWLQKRGAGTYAYDVRIAASRDEGATWSESIAVHDDGVLAEHGFATLVPLSEPGKVGVVWLDGRNMSGEGGGHGESVGDMTLRYAEVDAELAVTATAELDSRTCECCATAMTMTEQGPLVAFRDRSEDEVRDIGIVRRVSGRWSEPRVLANDGWKIHGCPVNGPQADARGRQAAVAWFSKAGDRPRVSLVISKDEGSGFGPAIPIAERGAEGFVDCAFLGDDRVAITWLEDDGEGMKLQLREVGGDGSLTPAVTIASTTRGRTGFPRLALAGDSLYVVWNEKGDSPRIHLARATVGR
ncbi:MAG: hypothetical protein ACSLFQ_18495 [Thermoanaerobaculia bacterium]